MKPAKKAASSRCASSGSTCAMYWSGRTTTSAPCVRSMPRSVEDVRPVLQVRAEHLLVVAQPVAALARQQQRGHGLDRELAMALLEDRAQVEHGIQVLARGGVYWRTGESGAPAGTRTARARRASHPRRRSRRRRRTGASGRRRCATWPSCTGRASVMRSTGAEWKRVPITKPVASRWCVASPLITEGRYCVPMPAVKRAVLLEVALELLRVHAFGRAAVRLLRRGR